MPRFGTSMKDNERDLFRQLPLTVDEDINLFNQYKKLYLNPAQLLANQCNPRLMMILGGRATGKSSFMGSRFIGCNQTIPRGLGIFAGVSQKQLMGKTVPALCKSNEQLFGIKEGLHFFRGQPPMKLKWPRPLTMPRTFENVIYFYTGHITMCLSLSQASSANGLNATEAYLDEFKFVYGSQLEVWEQSILPAIRGEMYDSPGWSEDNFYYLSQTLLSDPGLTFKQTALERKWEEAAASAEYLAIKEQIAEMIADFRMEPRLAQVKGFERKLNALRAKSMMVFRFSTLENIDLLPNGYISSLQATMPRIAFEVQVLGKKPRDIGSSGYYNYNSAIHGYLPNGDEQTNRINSTMMKKMRMKDSDGIRYDWESPDLEETEASIDSCYLDDDIDPHLPLRIAFDVGHDFNTVVIGQVHNDDTSRSYRGAGMGFRTLRIVNAMFVKNGERLEVLLRKFNSYYRDFRDRNREIILYTDDTMYQGGAYALQNVDDTRFGNVIKKKLTAAGWKVKEVRMSRPMLHNSKYNLLQEIFAENEKLHIRINMEQCDFLCVAVENTEAITTPKGIRKDKSLEKHKSEDGEAGKREFRSDVTDAMDSLIIGCAKYSDSGNLLSGGAIPPGVRLTLPFVR